MIKLDTLIKSVTLIKILIRCKNIQKDFLKSVKLIRIYLKLAKMILFYGQT